MSPELFGLPKPPSSLYITMMSKRVGGIHHNSLLNYRKSTSGLIK
jgi:hypothetical protein